MPDQASRLRALANRRRFRPAGTPFVMTVTSGKGGVGKSTLALNLAVVLSDLGRRVLLVDADSNLAGLDLMLGVAPEWRLADVFRGDREIAETLLHPLPGLSFLPGSSGDTQYPAVGMEEQRRLMEGLLGLDQPVDVLLIDTAAGMTPEVIGYTEWADEALVVTTPDPTAIVDAYAMMKIAWAVRGDAMLHVVMNNVRDPQEGAEALGKLEQAVRRFLKTEFRTYGMIPEDPCVGRALRAQRPAVRAYPGSPAALSIRRIAEGVRARQVRHSQGGVAV